jgi:hypothetical protein
MFCKVRKKLFLLRELQLNKVRKICLSYLVGEIDLCPSEDLNVFAEVVVGVDVDAVEGSN